MNSPKPSPTDKPSSTPCESGHVRVDYLHSDCPDVADVLDVGIDGEKHALCVDHIIEFAARIDEEDLHHVRERLTEIVADHAHPQRETAELGLAALHGLGGLALCL